MGVDARIGALVAAYRIERVLGRGGMGVVYVAEDARLGRRVALKLLSPELAGDARFRERFVRESRLAASLEHPNIVPIHAAGEEGGVLFLAMRFIEGTDLRALVGEHGPLEVERAARIVAGVAAALDAAHGQGLVHRDVKPSNVLLRELGGQDHAYLADFGLTKPTSSMTGLTGTGQIVGTVDYLAPEVIEGKPADPRADQYALGCVLYECLVGRPPFGRETEAATLWAHMRDKPPATGVDAADAVLARALAKSPDARYPSCGEMVADLDRRLPKPIAPAGLSRRAKLLAAGAVAVLVAATAAVTALFSGGAAAVFKPAPPNTVVAIDAKTGAIVGKPIPVGRAPTQIVVSGNNVWVANAAGRSISWIDARTRRLVNTIPLDATPTGIAAGAHGSVWVDEGLSRGVTQIVPSAGRRWIPKPTVPVPVCCAGPSVIAVTDSAAYVGTAEGIWRWDIPRRRWASRPLYAGPAAGSAAVAPDGTLYFSNGWDTLIHLFGRVVSADRNYVGGLVLGSGDGQVWYTLPATGTVAAGTACAACPTYGTPRLSANIGGEPAAVSASGGGVWVAGARSGVVTRLNDDLKRPRSLRLGDRLTGLAAHGGVVWIAVASTAAGVEATGSIYTGQGNGGFNAGPADGGRRRIITVAGGTPDFSPDGRQVVYTKAPPGAIKAGGLGNVAATWVAPLTFAGDIVPRVARQITHPRWPPGEQGASWSPDRRWIAAWRITHVRDGTHTRLGSEVLTFHPDGSAVRVVFTSRRAFTFDAQLDWSPDGRTLVVQDLDPQAPGDLGRLWLVGARSRGQRRLVTIADATSPRWSPDGTHIAFIANIRGPGIYVAGLTGETGLARIAVINEPAGTLGWSPDGRELAFAGSDAQGRNGVHIYYADGSGDTYLPGTSGNDSFPVWRPYL